MATLKGNPLGRSFLRTRLVFGQSLFGATYLASGPEDHESFCLKDVGVSLIEVDKTLCCRFAFAVTDTGSAAVVGAEG